MKTKAAKLYALILTAILLVSLIPASVFGAEENGQTQSAAQAEAEAQTEAEAGTETPQPADRSVVRTNGFADWPQALDIQSDYGCLMDATTGAVLFDKSENVATPPASLTKIMTTLLALEYGDLDAQVTMTQTGVDYAVDGSSNLFTQVGETFTLRDMLYGVMLKSANDMATQVGEYIGGGSLDHFIEMMNQKAEELGCRNTNFANACGMPNDEHVTTAYDLCLICKEAVKNETFMEIISTASYTIPATNMTGARTFENHHPFTTGGTAYEGFIGGKTGYTDAAQNTLATIAKRSTTTLIAVTLHGAGTDVTSSDARQLLDYGFDNFQHVRMTPKKYLVEGGIVSIPKDAVKEDVTSSSEETTSEEYGDVVVTSYKFSKHLVGTTTQTKAVVDELEAKAEAKRAKAEAEAAAKAAASMSAEEVLPAESAAEESMITDYAAGQSAEVRAGSETVSLPLGIMMNRTAFIAIAALSLLILLGILIIIITLITRKNED